MKEIKIFNIKIHPLTKEAFLEIIKLNLRSGNRIVQNGVNAASINGLVNNNELTKAYMNSDLINIDGMSMVWGLRFLGYIVPERVACPDLANDILILAERENYSVFLFGTNENSLEQSVKNLGASFPRLNIAGYRNGYYQIEDESEIVKMINNSQPDILFLGLPSPQKELFVEKYKDQLSVTYFFGVGGVFDILSGKTKRAPYWMQKRGLEWLYRFMQEPKRMWHRYMVGNIRFIVLILKQKWKIRNEGKERIKVDDFLKKTEV